MSRIDERVSRIKFHREVSRLEDQRTLLESRGIFIVARTFPFIDAVFVPRRSLHVITPVPQTGLIVLPAGVAQTQRIELPLTARAFKAHFDLTDYDIRAPSLLLVDPWTNEALPPEKIIGAMEFEKERRLHTVLIHPHPETRRPFLCLRGTREYHEHPQHAGDDWLLYRPVTSLFDTIISVWRVTLDLVSPTLQRLGNVFQLVWLGDEKP